MAQLVKNLPAMRETWVKIPGVGSSPGEGKGSPLQYSGLENSMNCIVLGVAKSQTQLSDFHFYRFCALSVFPIQMSTFKAYIQLDPNTEIPCTPI